MRGASKNAAIHCKGFFDTFGISGRSQIIPQKAQKDSIVFLIIENESIFNPFVINVRINPLFTIPIKIFGRHNITLPCKKRLVKCL